MNLKASFEASYAHFAAERAFLNGYPAQTPEAIEDKIAEDLRSNTSPTQQQPVPTQQQQPVVEKENDKLTDIDVEILGSKPIVPHSCCYILQPNNWLFYLLIVINYKTINNQLLF